MMGSSVKRNDVLVATYPSQKDLEKIYARALAACTSYTDLLILALYRQQVTTDEDCYTVVPDILADRAFFRFAVNCRPLLTAHEWEQLAIRMPKDSIVWKQLMRMAAGRTRRPVAA